MKIFVVFLIVCATITAQVLCSQNEAKHGGVNWNSNDSSENNSNNNDDDDDNARGNSGRRGQQQQQSQNQEGQQHSATWNVEQEVSALLARSNQHQQQRQQYGQGQQHQPQQNSQQQSHQQQQPQQNSEQQNWQQQQSQHSQQNSQNQQSQEENDQQTGQQTQQQQTERSYNWSQTANWPEALPYQRKITNRINNSQNLAARPEMSQHIVELADRRLNQCKSPIGDVLDRHCVGRLTGQMMQLINALENVNRRGSMSYGGAVYARSQY